jgi:phage-related protein (TIGR01555 family)
MAWIADSLRSAIAAAGRFNPFGNPTSTALPGIFTHQLALAAYMSSGMLRKVITIPAGDRTREWRDWQAEKDAIAKIEAEEKRLALRQKVKHAEILRGVGGGALILITAGNHADELKPDMIAAGGLVAVNVVSRWQITGTDWNRDLASPEYGMPGMWRIDSNGTQKDIHPSRVVCFRGDPIPAGSAVSDEDAFWGDSRLCRVFAEVQRSDQTQGWFGELVRKAKLLRIGIPNITDYTATSDGQSKLNARIQTIAEGESVLNATVYAAAAGQDQPGETISDFQVNWSGIPAVMDAFDQRVAAVSDIPFTRLMGRSPAGMNATGKSDMDNWDRAVGDGQENETRPCLEMIDPVLLRSAGVDGADVTWAWAPLWTPSEKEEAETFDKTMDALTKLQNTGTIPDVAFAKGVQNLMAEREYMPGLDQALGEIPEDERFGLNPEPDDDDPSANQGGAKGGGPDLPEGGDVDGSRRPARRAANDAWFSDATPRPLYVQRKLLNAADLIAWAKDSGLETTLPASDMHVTILYSKSPVDPMKMGRAWNEDEQGRITVRPGGPRVIERFDEGAVVLRFAAPDLEWRHREMIEAGGSHDFDAYHPHVTLTYSAPDGFDPETVKPYNGKLVFGPEIFEALDLDWKLKVSEE